MWHLMTILLFHPSKKFHELFKLRPTPKSLCYIGLFENCESLTKRGFTLHSKQVKNLFSFQKEISSLFKFFISKKTRKKLFFKSPFSQKKNFQLRFVKKKAATFFI